jgi:hypothetical protein
MLFNITTSSKTSHPYGKIMQKRSAYKNIALSKGCSKRGLRDIIEYYSSKTPLLSPL